MSASDSHSSAPDRSSAGVSWTEFFFVIILLAAGLIFLRDAPHWGSNAYVGRAQYGDAEFWWNGALHFSQGIIAENPNLTYRMGYAAFGGTLAAVLGPDYRAFHLILLGCFLAMGAWLYFSLRRPLGRTAAASAVLLLVFNPFTAEWLAISTSDGLGLVFNLAAMLTLVAGIRDGLRPRWIALFGLLFSCGSLTRPLLTPFIVAAAVGVVAAGGWKWRRTLGSLTVLGTAFIAPTLIWMGFMAVTTGNFALTGASQDSSAFYAASDPHIQVWRSEMYADVTSSARERYHTDNPNPRQLNAEFWTLTARNYRMYWRFHAARLGRHILAVARFTPARAAAASPEGNWFRTALLLAVTVALARGAYARNNPIGAIATAGLGVLWALYPAFQPWAVLSASLLGLLLLFHGQRPLFLWASYWWAGTLSLYLTGCTWGPPLGPMQDINALGYRLGFQCFFAADIMVLGALAWLARPPLHADATPPVTARWLRYGALTAGAILTLMLMAGAAIVTFRLVARSTRTPVPYPSTAAVAGDIRLGGATPVTDITALRTTLNLQQGQRLLTRAMSSGFIWDLIDQQRSILLIYQQDLIQPVHFSPRQIFVEIPRALHERAWMERRGAWLLRSFPDTAQTSNLPYYLEMPAVQAFIPLSADGKGYDLARAEFFPLTKYATQLTASRELIWEGAIPEWMANSGTQGRQRRVAVHPTAGNVALRFDLNRSDGSKSLRLGVQVESTRPGPVDLRLLRGDDTLGAPLWTARLFATDSQPLQANLDIARGTKSLQLDCSGLQTDDILWFYELVLTADDFTQ